jgi:hypothetical protein
MRSKGMTSCADAASTADSPTKREQDWKVVGLSRRWRAADDFDWFAEHVAREVEDMDRSFVEEASRDRWVAGPGGALQFAAVHQQHGRRRERAGVDPLLEGDIDRREGRLKPAW